MIRARQTALVRGLVAAAALAIVVRTVLANTDPHVGDYGRDAGPAIDALARFDLHGFVHSVPLMGSLSLVLRAPVVAAVNALGGGRTLGIELGALVCLLPALALGAWLLGAMGRRGTPLPARAAIALLFVLTPFLGAAVHYGHPEEILTITFCVVAVLLAHDGRSAWAGLALGLAIATKQWALVALAPALVAAPRGRVKLVLLAVAVVAAFTLPAALADTRSFSTGARGLASAHSWVSVVSVWWPVSNFHTRLVSDGVGLVSYTTFTLPASLNLIPRALIVTIGAPLGAILLLRGRRPTLDQALSLLALLLLLRCVLDPWNNLYYQLPLLVAIYCRDALCARALPLASLFATVTCWAIFWHFAGAGRTTSTYVLYMAWAAALGTWLVIQAFEIRLPAALSAQLAAPRRRAAQAA